MIVPGFVPPLEGKKWVTGITGLRPFIGSVGKPFRVFTAGITLTKNVDDNINMTTNGKYTS